VILNFIDSIVEKLKSFTNTVEVTEWPKNKSSFATGTNNSLVSV
jgi:hypothetical protein